MNVYHENQVPWPENKPYTKERKNGPFKVTLATAAQRVEGAVSAFTKLKAAWRSKECWIYIDGAEMGQRNQFLANRAFDAKRSPQTCF